MTPELNTFLRNQPDNRRHLDAEFSHIVYEQDVVFIYFNSGFIMGIDDPFKAIPQGMFGIRMKPESLEKLTADSYSTWLLLLESKKTYPSLLTEDSNE